jgi:hypothetical protein
MARTFDDVDGDELTARLNGYGDRIIVHLPFVPGASRYFTPAAVRELAEYLYELADEAEVRAL